MGDALWVARISCGFPRGSGPSGAAIAGLAPYGVQTVCRLPGDSAGPKPCLHEVPRLSRVPAWLQYSWVGENGTFGPRETLVALLPYPGWQPRELIILAARAPHTDSVMTPGLCVLASPKYHCHEFSMGNSGQHAVPVLSPDLSKPLPCLYECLRLLGVLQSEGMEILAV